MATRKKQGTGNGERGMAAARVPTRPVVVDAAHCWLERTNPLVGVSIRVAQNIWDAARGGDTQRLHWLFQEIEAANPILFTCIDRRQSAIAGFLLKVSALPSADQALADIRQAKKVGMLSIDELLLKTSTIMSDATIPIEERVEQT